MNGRGILKKAPGPKRKKEGLDDKDRKRVKIADSSIDSMEAPLDETLEAEDLETSNTP